MYLVTYCADQTTVLLGRGHGSKRAQVRGLHSAREESCSKCERQVCVSCLEQEANSTDRKIGLARADSAKMTYACSAATPDCSWQTVDSD